jgi:Zn-dependent protease with chaperone function
MSKTMLTGIAPQAWEHPTDRAALNSLRRVPGLDIAIRTLFGLTTERALRFYFLGSSVKVTDKQFPRVMNISREVNNLFGVEKAPEIFVTQSPSFNAAATGYHNPFILINSSLLDAFSDEELACVYAHELGHILSGHVLYKTILAILIRLSIFTFSIPLSGTAILALIIALREWDRKSELSSDRAGLLAVQDVTVSQKTLMKLAGGRNIEQMDLDEFRKQAKEYAESNDIIDQVIKFLNMFEQRHPFAVLRVIELEEWAKSEAYQKIISGEFDTAKNMNHLTDIKDVGSIYGSTLKKSFFGATKPIANLFGYGE